MKRIGVLGAAVTLALPLMGGVSFLAVPAYAAVTCQPGTSAPSDSFPGTVVTADNFESGSLSKYSVQATGAATVSVSSAFAQDGACSAYIHVPSDATSVGNFSTPLPSGTKEVYADGWFNITQGGASGNNVPYFRFFSGTTRFVDLYRDNTTGKLWLRSLQPDGVTYTYTAIGTAAVALSTWHHVAMHVIPNGATTTVEVWIDGALLYSSATVNTSATSVTSVMNGAEHVSQAEDTYIDDLIVKSVGASTPAAPVASFTASATTGTAPLAVSFTDTSTGSPTSWSWDFGDGSTSTVQNPAHTYSAAGTYTVTLTDSNAGGASKAASAVITVSAATLAQQMDAKAAQWGLGAATSAVTAIRNGGFYRNYQYGAVISAPSKSLFVSHGAIRGEWAALGFENGVMGYPSTDEVGGLRSGGVYQNYDGGAIIWSPATGAHESLGAIRGVWQQLGFEGGVLGYPTTEVVTGLVNGGLYQNYQGGAIVSSPAAGTHGSYGPIRTEWQSTGFERGVLGYPSTGVVTGLVNGGFYQNYQGGAIVSSPASGTHESYGPIRAAWQSTGFERGVLGYPTSEVYTVPGGTAQNYQGGKITDINGTITITHP